MWNWTQWPWSPETEAPTAAQPQPQTAVEAVLAERADVRDKIKAIRDRADASAKVIGAVATALAGYLGVAKLSDIFPLHTATDLDVQVLSGLGAAMVLLVGGVIWWVSLLGRVSAPVVLTPAVPPANVDPNDLSEAEVKLVAAQYDGHAALNDAPSLDELDTYLRTSLGAGKDADGNWKPVSGLTARDGTSPWKPSGDPEVLDAEIRVVLVRAVQDVVRSRYRDAFASWPARGAMALAAAGYVGLALSTNYLVGQSSGQVSRASQCAKLVDTQLKSSLKPTRALASCDGLVPGIEGAYRRSTAKPTTTTPAATTPAATTP